MGRCGASGASRSGRGTGIRENVGPMSGRPRFDSGNAVFRGLIRSDKCQANVRPSVEGATKERATKGGATKDPDDSNLCRPEFVPPGGSEFTAFSRVESASSSRLAQNRFRGRGTGPVLLWRRARSSGSRRADRSSVNPLLWLLLLDRRAAGRGQADGFPIGR